MTTKTTNSQADTGVQEYTCHDCGIKGDKNRVCPQRGALAGLAFCNPCVVKRNRQWKADRKRQLDAMPRCEFCNRRGSHKVGCGPNPARLCGYHWNIARREDAMQGFGSMFSPATGDDVREMVRNAK